MPKKTQGPSAKAYYTRNKGIPTKRTGYRKGTKNVTTPNVKPASVDLGNIYALLDRKITEAVKAKGKSNSAIGFQRLSEPSSKWKREALNLAVA